MVYAGVAGLWGDTLNVNGALVFGVAFVVGLSCGLTAHPPLLAVRDWILNAIAVVAVALLVVVRLFSGGATAITYLVLVGALAIGLALGGFRRLTVPATGIALLGGVELLDFFYSPFGAAHFIPDSQVLVLGVVAAAAVGFVIRLNAAFVIILAGLSIALLTVFLQFFLWLEQQNGGAASPDWTGALAWLGVALGYGLMRPAFAYAARLR